jgi:hypothetical protein
MQAACRPERKPVIIGIVTPGRNDVSEPTRWLQPFGEETAEQGGKRRPEFLRGIGLLVESRRYGRWQCHDGSQGLRG